MKGTTLFLLLLSIIAPFYHCQKQENPGSVPSPPEKVIPVDASITGRITDEQLLPLKGVAIKLGNSTATSDVNGYFRFIRVAVTNSNAAFVIAEKSEYFRGSRTFKVKADGTAFISIQLIKKRNAVTFNAATGGSVTVPENGGSISFPVNGVVNASSGAAYTGTTSVSAFYLNPSASNFLEIMPGALVGVDSTNRQVGLQSFGMMAVELSGTGGEKLQLANGKTAGITFPIPVGLSSQAPATIPLWSFDEVSGLWKKEGTAQRQGNNYVGAVGHFSFWNCDAPYQIVNFEAKFINQSGDPVFNSRVLIKTLGDSISVYGFGYTDTAGIVTGSVPANKSLQLQLYNQCGDKIFTRDIGPYSGTANLGSVTVQIAPRTQLTVSGAVTNCDGNPLQNGVVDVEINRLHNHIQVTNGTFRATIPICTAAGLTATLTPYDVDKNLQGSGKQFIVSGTEILSGTLSACGVTTNEYLNFTFDGRTVSYGVPRDSLTIYAMTGGYSLSASRYTNSSSNNFMLRFLGTAVGTGTIQSIDIVDGGTFWRQISGGTVNLTAVDPTPGYISGSFTTTVRKDSSTLAYPLTGNFRVKHY